MMTRAEIARLTPKGRTQLFDELTGALFRTQEETATALEITRRTVQVWRKEDTVPLMALYALHSMAEGQLMQDLGAVIAHLDRIATVLAQLVTPAAAREPRGSAGSTGAASAGSAGSRQ